MTILRVTTGKLAFLATDSIVVNTIKSHSGFKKVYLFENAVAIKSYGYSNCKMIYDLGRLSKVALEDLKALCEEGNVANYQCIAIVLESEFLKVSFNILFKFFESKIPIKLFSTLEEATAWVKTI